MNNVVTPFGNPLVHRVSAATNKMELARCAKDANPGNITYAFDYHRAKQEREAAILALRATFKLVWVNPDVK
jgi:hypothetical protein